MIPFVVMASACVNNIGVPSEKFSTTYPSYGWLSPRISFSREFSEEESKVVGSKPQSPTKTPSDPLDSTDLEISGKDAGDFEFRLEDPVTMLPADELFSDGKLVPLQLSVNKHRTSSTTSFEVRSPESAISRRISEVSGIDPFLFSPKAPRCSSRWKELLGLKKLYQNAKTDNQKVTSTSSPSLPSNNSKLKYFLHRNTKSSSVALSDSSLSLPLLRDSDCESVSISARLSLSSSSSSGHDHEDLPRLSLDSDKPKNPNQNPNPNPPRVRVVKSRGSNTETSNPNRVGRSTVRRSQPEPVGSRGVSVDSPRMNSSGKIVFQSLERSSSSPSSFNGGPRFKHRGMERSYSANVRITPVLNVPVCSLRGSSKSGVFGFGQLFSSPQKKENSSSNGGGANRGHQSNSRNRTDRT